MAGLRIVTHAPNVAAHLAAHRLVGSVHRIGDELDQNAVAAVGPQALEQISRLYFLAVAVANSRGPETLASLTQELGPNVSACSVQDASQAETIFLAVPFPVHQTVAKQRPDWQGQDRR